jgi:hypothetical protein
MAWCDAACTDMHVTNLQTAHDVVIALPGPAEHAQFAPDGRSIAIAVRSAALIASTSSGETKAVISDKRLGERPDVGWSVNGTQLFVSSNSYAGDETFLARYDVVTGDHEVVRIAIGGFMSFVVATNGEARPFQEGPRALPTDCTPPPVARPRAFERACTFDITR